MKHLEIDVEIKIGSVELTRSRTIWRDENGKIERIEKNPHIVCCGIDYCFECLDKGRKEFHVLLGRLLKVLVRLWMIAHLLAVVQTLVGTVQRL